MQGWRLPPLLLNEFGRVGGQGVASCAATPVLPTEFHAQKAFEDDRNSITGDSAVRPQGVHSNKKIWETEAHIATLDSTNGVAAKAAT